MMLFTYESCVRLLFLCIFVRFNVFSVMGEGRLCFTFHFRNQKKKEERKDIYWILY